MGERVLITGGAGFIGSHLSSALVARGMQVRILDNLEPQVHGPGASWPGYLDERVTRYYGDICNPHAVREVLDDVDIVFHLAAATGVGQSMYQIEKYFRVNVQGTATLLDALLETPNRVRKLILASSRAVYGEGAYTCQLCGPAHPNVRSSRQLELGAWEPWCPTCGAVLRPILTTETLDPSPGSMYAITKLSQEQMCMCFGRAHDLPTVALRFFNVYGPRQSLSNPYTGIIPAFLNRLRALQSPEIYEDGQMTRDFAYVSDVVQACVQAMERVEADYRTLNVGSGQPTSILKVAQLLKGIVAPDVSSRISGVARIGDIRHCTADLTQITACLGYVPTTSLEEGLRRVVAAAEESPLPDLSATARAELVNQGLLRQFSEPMLEKPGIEVGTNSVNS